MATSTYQIGRASCRERGIEINAEGKDQTKNAMKKVGEAMKAQLRLVAHRFRAMT